MMLEKPIDEQMRYARAKAYFLQRRASRRDLPYNVSPERWIAILTTWGERCAFCGRSADTVGAPLTADHFVPLCDPLCMGSTAWNIIPACGPCNWDKRGGDPFIWIDQRFGHEQGRAITQRILTYLSEARRWYYTDKSERRRQKRAANIVK